MGPKILALLLTNLAIILLLSFWLPVWCIVAVEGLVLVLTGVIMLK